MTANKKPLFQGRRIVHFVRSILHQASKRRVTFVALTENERPIVVSTYVRDNDDSYGANYSISNGEVYCGKWLSQLNKRGEASIHGRYPFPRGKIDVLVWRGAQYVKVSLPHSHTPLAMRGPPLEPTIKAILGLCLFCCFVFHVWDQVMTKPTFNNANFLLGGQVLIPTHDDVGGDASREFVAASHDDRVRGGALQDLGILLQRELLQRVHLSMGRLVSSFDEKASRRKG